MMYIVGNSNNVEYGRRTVRTSAYNREIDKVVY